MNISIFNRIHKRKLLAALTQLLPFFLERIRDSARLMTEINDLIAVNIVGKTVAISALGKINFIVECKTIERNQAYKIR